MSAANDDDQLISVTRAAINEFTYMLDSVRELKSGNTLRFLQGDGATTTSLFDYQLRGLLHDYHEKVSKVREELDTRPLDQLTESQRQVVAEFSELLRELDAECQTNELAL